ncbi:dihydrolipoyl dehydrogenase [Alteribacillus bidgolensis]|uniref:Dihydrolipoyl dehydrogenase n=1 Tax=Alteribacillus bidgolensis TaxID=930129 RepID=A0A1G8FXJ1_9BACI|nr:dihydrolipoyl dehydrogenase [Alteribacillus bidgolensis]SDH86889.1 dihydrolipoamide dehydrogenase [Alteribacillus bidgolensis]
MTIAIIGGGPAGYVAAIIAAQQEEEVILIEEKDLGGTCLNEGCMPTKSLLQSAETFEKVKKAEQFGISVPLEQININWTNVLSHKKAVVNQLVQGIGYLMKKNKIRVLQGKASFVTEDSIAVEHQGKEQVIEADRIIISTGSEPVSLPFAPFDGDWVLHSGQAMSLREIPSSLLIVGGGVIGCEFASIYSRMGTKVTMVEMADQLLPGEDQDVAAILQQELENSNVSVYTSASLQQITKENKTAVVGYNGKIHELSADYLLVSVGRKARIEGLGLENIGVQVSKQGITVNQHMQTNLPHVYACGDVIGGIQLAHVAFHEGTIAATHACGEDATANYRAVPRCIYTAPEIASVGMTEEQARLKYGNIRTGEFSLAANGKALISKEQIGKVKIIVETEFNEIVGISIIGPHATELIGQGTTLLHLETTVDLMEDFIAAHPTLSEAIHEGLLNTVGHAVHA